MKTLTWPAVALLAACSQAQSIDLSKPAIVVNGQPITYETYYKRMERLNGFGRRVGDAFVPATPGFLTLQQLINEQLVLDLAVEKGVAPTAEEIAGEYKSMMASDPDRVKGALAHGTTEEDIKHQIQVQLSEFKLQTMGINISDQQVDTFYKEHPTMYTTPKAIDLYAISVENTEQQDAVDKKLNANTPFSDVAKELSVDLSKQIGGYLGRRIESTLPDRLRTKIEVLKEGETTAWVDAGDLKYKYFVAKVFPAQLSPLTPELRKAIRQRLMVDRGATKNDLGAMLKQMRAKVKLQFVGSPFDDELKDVFQGGQ